jgi:hypothetical protein
MKITNKLRTSLLEKGIVGYTINLFANSSGSHLYDFTSIGLNFYKHKRRDS